MPPVAHSRKHASRGAPGPSASGPAQATWIASATRPFAWVVSGLAKRLGFGQRFAPGQTGEIYLETEAFETNELTNDRAMFDYMRTQQITHPDLALGGPSMSWLHEALLEMRALNAMPSPDVPTIAFLGTGETIVDPQRIRDRMARWPGGALIEVAGGKHETMMERPEARALLFDRTAAHFASHSGD